LWPVAGELLCDPISAIAALATFIKNDGNVIFDGLIKAGNGSSYTPRSASKVPIAGSRPYREPTLNV
jgi:hypothetical protein